jgi:hypothetical protein
MLTDSSEDSNRNEYEQRNCEVQSDQNHIEKDEKRDLLRLFSKTVGTVQAFGKKNDR